MDLFTVNDGVDSKDLHPKFNLLNDCVSYEGAKKIISGWGQDFYDKDKKAKTEFQNTFHSTFWELYLHAVIKELGFTTSTLHDRPDFIVEHPSSLYIEAVVSEIRKNGVSEECRTPENVLKNLEPIYTREEFSEVIDEAIVRHSNSFISKLKKYRGYENKGKSVKGYVECDWVSQNVPYVIAIASYDQIAYGREFVYSMLALLYGKYFDPETKQYNDKVSIKKKDTGADIKLGFFSNSSYHEVSAVIFTNTLTLGKLASLYKSENKSSDFILNIRHVLEEPHFRLHEVSSDNPETLLDGLYVFHNPYASNPIDMKLFPQLAQFSCDDHGFYQYGEHSLIASRYHASFQPFNKLVQLQKLAAFASYNREWCERQEKEDF